MHNISQYLNVNFSFINFLKLKEIYISNIVRDYELKLVLITNDKDYIYF